MNTRDALDRLVQVASSDDSESEASTQDALRLLASLRTTPDEGRAIELLLALHANRPLPEELRVAVAGTLADRGEELAALRTLSDATSSASLLMRADLLARAGSLTEAVAAVERVLARDIDWPGARERRMRWAQGLGLGMAAPNPSPASPRGEYSSTEGTRLHADAPFRLLREIARGGAGTVYEAEDRALGRRVALKVYHQPDRDREQLRHEARVAVALSGEGVVRVYDLDVDHGWLAMQWAPLGALGAHLKSRDRPVVTAVGGWGGSLARALARVHAAGWVHHDVKPANILLASNDAAVLTDFGTARRIGEPSPPGSLGYVSPERLAGRASDPRDDVYGFGRVLHQALDALETLSPSDADELRRVASACTGPDATRPANGRELSELLGIRASSR